MGGSSTASIRLYAVALYKTIGSVFGNEPNSSPSHPPPPNKDRIKLNEGFPGAYVGLVLGGGCVGGGSAGSIRLYAVALDHNPRIHLHLTRCSY